MYLIVAEVKVNPVTEQVEYRLVHRPFDEPIEITSSPENILESEFFKHAGI